MTNENRPCSCIRFDIPLKDDYANRASYDTAMPGRNHLESQLAPVDLT